MRRREPTSGPLRTRVARFVALLSLALGGILAHSVPGDAHEKHRQAPSDSDTVVSRPGSLPMDSPVSDSASSPSTFEMPPISEALTHHLHNKLVHFPIVLTPLAFLALLLRRRRSELGGLARALSWLAVLSAGAALWAGLAQAPDFEGEPKEWLMLLHRNLGIATTATLVVAALLGQWRSTSRHAWIPTLLAVVLISIGAYLGGLVSHG
jgi:uncharacterized membrane protein